MRLTLIIPALNPDNQLLELVKEIRIQHLPLHIVIVDDGSDSTTAAIFEDLKYNYDCMICRHAENYGKGAAIKTGIAYVLQRYPKNNGFLTADADGQHQAADIRKVVTAMAEYPEHIILGTRDLTRGKVPLKSRLGNLITAGTFTMITGISLNDTQTGLRGIPGRYAKLALTVEGRRYEYETHFLLQAANRKILFKEVEIPTIYINHNQGSHFRPIRDAFRIYYIILKYSLFSAQSFRRRQAKPGAYLK